MYRTRQSSRPEAVSAAVERRAEVLDYCRTQHPRNPVARLACMVKNSLNRDD